MAIRKNKNGNGANSIIKEIEKVKEGNEKQDDSKLDILVGKGNFTSSEGKDIIIQKQNNENIPNKVNNKEKPAKNNIESIQKHDNNKHNLQKQKMNELVQPKKEDFTMKRSYSLKPSTYLKLQELKVFELAKIKLEYAALNYNDIVDMAICQFYSNIKTKISKESDHK